MTRMFIAAVVLAIALPAMAQTGKPSLVLTTKPTPLGIGQNLFELTLKDASGRPIADAEVAIVLVMPADPKTKHPEMKSEGKLNNVGKGVYNGIAMVTMAGEWHITVTATQNGKQLGQKTEKMTALLTRPKPEASRGK